MSSGLVLSSSASPLPASVSAYPPPEKWNGPVIAVFCGSKDGKSPAHLEAAHSLGKALHAAGAKLVYGGGTLGIMGMVAKTLVSLSGPNSVHGVIPQALMQYERSGANDTHVPDEAIWGRTTVVPDMHTRKSIMAREVVSGGLGSGFVALSGGLGTLEELAEVSTWNQLGIHRMPVCLFNVNGYWDKILSWLKDDAVQEGFVTLDNAGIMVEGKTADEVLRQLQEYKVSEGRFHLDWTQN